MEKHIDAMGFILAAIVISISLVGDREAKRSKRQIEDTERYGDRLREMLRMGQRISPGTVSDWVRRSMTKRDDVIVASHVLNIFLVVIVLVVGCDALRLLFWEHVDGPPDATLLVVSLMSGAFVTGVYGEVHAWMERSKALSEFNHSDLGILQHVSASLRPAAKSSWPFEPGSVSDEDLDNAETQIQQVAERFPGWEFVAELRAMVLLIRGKAAEAAQLLLAEHESGVVGYDLPILLTLAMSRTGRLEEVLPKLDQLARRRGQDPMLDELRFDLGLAAAHRDRLFGGDAPVSGAAVTALDRLTFDITLADVRETSVLQQFGRAWTDSETSDEWRPDALPESRQLPISWHWQLTHGEEPSGGMTALHEWRVGTTDAGALESLAFACLAVRRDEDAADLFETAIRFNSSSGSAHWGVALAYFRRSWTDKARISLKRARTCGYSKVLCDLTEAQFDAADDAASALTSQEKWNELGGPLDLATHVDLGLLGMQSRVADDGSPRNAYANMLIDVAGASSAYVR